MQHSSLQGGPAILTDAGRFTCRKGSKKHATRGLETRRRHDEHDYTRLSGSEQGHAPPALIPVIIAQEPIDGAVVKRAIFLPLSSTSREDPRKLAAAFYDRFADEYQSWEGATNWPRIRWLRKVLDRLSPGSAVLDLGCGSGDPADIEIAQRHSVTGVDISAEQIRRARRNVPNGRFIHGDLASVERPDESFDAVVSFYALDQVPRAEHQVILQRCYSLLRPGGFLLLSLETVDEEAKYGSWQGATVMLSAFDEATTLRIVTGAGFSVIETATEAQMERDHEVPFLWILAQRPE